ncbi:hypothetical protein, partial [Ruoffia tabacinasalis]|uniref:hypothetical protein n=1 Tax=Ruoffia tabacinasalis TaxID=87458 RepID=UPI001BB0DEC2
EILEVDWAGQTLSVIDPDTGENRKVYIFIATLPCSQMFYVEGEYGIRNRPPVRNFRPLYASKKSTKCENNRPIV